MLRPIIYPYKFGSRSARDLSKSLANLRSKRVHENGSYVPFGNHLIVNWGSPRMPKWANNKGRWFNGPGAVGRAIDKLLFYQTIKSSVEKVNIPDFTTDRSVAEDWIDEGSQVLCRTSLNGHGGIGITLASKLTDLIQAPLYTSYEKKKTEYRVHVFNGTIIHIQEKRRKKGFEDRDNQIRNHDNGWVFCVENVQAPQAVKDQAVLAVKAVGLHFGAVDIGWNEKHKRATVYEVNTAPGLCPTTLGIYSEAIREACK